VVFALIAACVFNGHHIAYIFNDTNGRFVSFRGGANTTFLSIRDGVTGGAEGGIVSKIEQSLGQSVSLIGRSAQQVQGQTKGSLLTDAGKTADFLYGSFYFSRREIHVLSKVRDCAYL
jgi:hypothetical protein